MRYFLRLSYNGSAFHGWQRQPNAMSVQQTIEEALSTLLRLPIAIVGAGRTDAGVHAREMFAHFDVAAPIDDEKRFLNSLNRLAGKNISLFSLHKVSDTSHARFDATLRTYKYFISFSKNSFLYPFCWFSPSDLDISAMNEAARILTEIEDFTSFAKLHSDAKTNICNVSRAEWTPLGREFPLMDNGYVFTISADRFLRNMVRAIVGTLVEVGRKKMTINDFKSVIESKDRCAAGTSMPPEALFLWSIKYPYI